jgi:hypothetical protein
MNNTTPVRSNVIILKQLLNHIRLGLINRVARETGVANQARTFSVLSHLTAMLFAQLSHAISLNDVCDSLRMNEGICATIRGATPPCRNTLSHANKIRDSAMAESLYWAMLEHLMRQTPGFAKGPVRRGFLRRFRRTIHAVDSTTIQLVAHCMDWAKHRRRKAAAKCHLRLNLQSFLPACAIVDTAKEHDIRKAHSVCAGLESGEIAVFDKAYTDFKHLHVLTARGVWWVTRAKDNLTGRVIERLQTTDNPRILSDELIELTVFCSRRDYPQPLRRVVALVEVEGEVVEMAFLTNQLTWSAWTVAELYRCRWDIEVFFKEIKQTLQLADFLGHSANAVRWQIWIGLLVHLLLRYLAYLHSWGHSFTRLFTVVRASLWRRWHLADMLDRYGTAKPPGRIRATPELAYLPGFA